MAPPPTIIQRQQQLASEMTGSEGNTPIKVPPKRIDCVRLVVVLQPQMGDELLTAQIP